MIVNPTVQELDELIASGKPVLIDLYGEWCSPCKMFAPIYERVAAAAADRAAFLKVDVDVCPEIAQRYNVMSVPYIVGISGGEVRHTSSGLMNESALTNLVDSLAQ